MLLMVCFLFCKKVLSFNSRKHLIYGFGGVDWQCGFLDRKWTLTLGFFDFVIYLCIFFFKDEDTQAFYLFSLFNVDLLRGKMRNLP